jgi:hypothetical protein
MEWGGRGSRNGSGRAAVRTMPPPPAARPLRTLRPLQQSTASPIDPPSSGAARPAAAQLGALSVSVSLSQCQPAVLWVSSGGGPSSRGRLPFVCSFSFFLLRPVDHGDGGSGRMRPSTVHRSIDPPVRSLVLPSRASAEQIQRAAADRTAAQRRGRRQRANPAQRTPSPTQREQERAEQTASDCGQRAANRGESRRAERWATVETREKRGERRAAVTAARLGSDATLRWC